MKVSELSGELLDHWVAEAEGFYEHDGIYYRSKYRTGCVCTKSAFKPSQDWNQGGPIIEREHITLLFDENDDDPEWSAHSKAYLDVAGELQWSLAALGATPLIAAMRAYVVSKFGDEVPTE